MAFMGIFLIGVVFFLAVIGGSTLIGSILLIIALVQWNKQNKGRTARKPAKIIVPGTIGGIFMLPLIFVIVYMGWAMAASRWESYTSLALNVTSGNYERAETLLRRGANPDCTLEGKDAVDGEQTLLSVLCENGGFLDFSENPVDDVVTDEELAMMQLLIDYGADLEAVDYYHEKESDIHYYTEDSDYFMPSDECGYTPLMHAVRNRDLRTVELLVENGANVNVTDYCGFGVVHTIVDNMEDDDGAEMLRYLVSQGADVTAETNFGQNAPFLLYRNNWEEISELEEILAENWTGTYEMD